MNKNKHLTLDERVTIEKELDNGSSFKYISETVGKDCTTISKEVRKHPTSVKAGSYGKGFNDCLHAADHTCDRRNACDRCTYPSRHYCWSCGRCRSTCTRYEKYECPKLKKPPTCATRVPTGTAAHWKKPTTRPAGPSARMKA